MQIPLDEKEILKRIGEKKEELGQKLLILTHHYQRKAIVDLGDYRGDSFDLSKKGAADLNARHIIFCGVHFMAESAAILAKPHQTVQIPNVEAGCWMAGMADDETVEAVWEELETTLGKDAVVPIVYMNSDASLKAFCGRHGGSVCTSSNALAALRWGFSLKEKVLFFPDQHLGRNVGNTLGLKPEDMIVWDPAKPLGGNDIESVKRARLILWNGYCLVHTRFQVEQIEKMRERFPGAKVVVHPECPQELVAKADACGSTSFIVNYVKDAPAGSTVIIGTEINLVHRLSLEYPEKQVIDLHYSLCPNMFKISPANLLNTLENIGKTNVITVEEPIRSQARLALDRMLALA